MKQLLLIFSIALILSDTSSAQGTWVKKASLPAAPRSAAVAFAASGKGYVGTGLDSSGNLLNDFWQYDPASDTWMQVADFTSSARRGAVAFEINGFGYVGSGYDGNNLSDFHKYDPASNSWTPVDSLGKTANALGRREATSFTIQQKGYVVAGYDGTPLYNNETWEYDETRDTSWKELKNLQNSGRRWPIGFSASHYGYVGMGFNHSQDYLKDFWRYDTVSNSWTQVSNYPGTGRASAVSFVINGKAYAGTGYDGTYAGDFFCYNDTNNTWHQIASYGGGSVTGAVAFSINGKGYVCCGKDSTLYRNDLWEYTPDTITGIKENGNAISAINMYPNPVKDILHVSIPRITDNSVLSLIDDTGRLLWKREFTKGKTIEESISVREFENGIYTLQMQTSSKVSTKTFVKH